MICGHYYRLIFGYCWIIPGVMFAQKPVSNTHFQDNIRPVLQQFCGDCHSPEEENDVPFLAAETRADLNHARGLWSSVASQLLNRTMPPPDEVQPTEAQRLEISRWIKDYLRASACDEGEFAPSITTRRLNRHEYDNTIRDLVGLDLPFSDSFPVDGSGGEGFDNNGETLFLPPILMERYLEAADLIVNQAIISPLFQKQFLQKDFTHPAGEKNPGKSLIQLPADQSTTLVVRIFTTANYQMEFVVGNQKGQSDFVLAIDQIPAKRFRLKSDEKQTKLSTTIRLERGVHLISLKYQVEAASQQSKPLPLAIYKAKLSESRKPIPTERQSIHAKIMQPGENLLPQSPRQAAAKVLGNFASRAYRRPVLEAELAQLMTLYDRSAARGDPYEESIKLSLKAVLVSPNFLFKIENLPQSSEITLLDDYALATRLSYFLWASMPDETLLAVADRGELNRPDELKKQVTRMLKDEKAWAFYENFTGQWLGTRDVGGRARPVGNEFKGIYTAELAFDLREEPVRLMQYLMHENRSLLELISADYSFVTARIAKHYQLKDVSGNHFRKVTIPNGQRGGIIRCAAVHLMTADNRRTSPVLRGAWILETLLGTPVPSPPPGIPELKTKSKENEKLTLREIFQSHREDKTCAACHNLIDPLGFAMENYDQLGRWRTKEKNKPLDVTGVMPSGESFNGPEELLAVILNRKTEFVHTLSSKMLGFALGRSLEDRDQCAIENIVNQLEEHNYQAQELVKAIVLSSPFRKQQRMPSSHP